MQILKTRRGQAIVGTALGAHPIGGVAFAASFVFGSFGGQTHLVDATAALSIVSVSNGGSTGGVDCSSAKQTGASTFEVSPTAKRLVLQGQGTVSPGNCTVLINVKNDGDVPVTPGIKATQVPEGWTFEKDGESKPVTIGAKGTGVLILRATATEKATKGGIAGQLTGDTAAPAGGEKAADTKE